MFRDRADIPRLAHTGDHTGNTEAEGDRRGNSQGQFLALVVDLGVITAEPTLEDEVVGDGDSGVDGQPVGDEVHEVFQDGLEVGVAGDGDGEGHARSEEGPDKAGYALRVAAQDLQGQGDGVDVGAVIGDDGQGQDHQAELAESAERLEDGGQQTTVTRGLVAGGVLVVTTVQVGGGEDGDTQHLGEKQGNDQTEPGGTENLATAAGSRLVHGVVGGVTSPASCKTVDGRAEGQDAAQLGSTGIHGKVEEITRVREATQHDEENDAGGDPAPVFVGVNDLVSGEGDEEGAEGNDEDTGKTRDIAVDRIEELGTDDGVGGRPTDTGNDVQDRNYRQRTLARPIIRYGSYGATYRTSRDTIRTRNEKAPSGAIRKQVRSRRRSRPS